MDKFATRLGWTIIVIGASLAMVFVLFSIFHGINVLADCGPGFFFSGSAEIQTCTIDQN